MNEFKLLEERLKKLNSWEKTKDVSAQHRIVYYSDGSGYLELDKGPTKERKQLFYWCEGEMSERLDKYITEKQKTVSSRIQDLFASLHKITNEIQEELKKENK